MTQFSRFHGDPRLNIRGSTCRVLDAHDSIILGAKLAFTQSSSKLVTPLHVDSNVSLKHVYVYCAYYST